MSVKLFPHQVKALNDLKTLNKVALYWDMGLGKTYGGSEKIMELGKRVNLIICQKSKVQDWVDHFRVNYPDYQVLNITTLNGMRPFLSWSHANLNIVGVINYELAFRRPELSKLTDFTLLLDESSLIQNEQAKRTKFILNKLKPANVILLSGTPTGGKYENLWSQMRLLGWEISKTTYWNTYVDYHYEDYGGFPVKVIDGYKNVDRLKKKMRDYGCHFLKTDEVIDLPDQIFTEVKVPVSNWYKKFRKDRVVKFQWEDNVVNTCDPNDNGETKLVGDNTLTAMLYERQLCGMYSETKMDAFKDLLDSTNDRLIVFYNFTGEMTELRDLCCNADRPVSIVNGQFKALTNYEHYDNSVTLIQYQAGAMGLNLQKANKIIYFTPPLSSELYEQSKKRIHRINQDRTCYYYNLIVKGSIEEKIYKTLAMRKDFTEALFMEVDK